MFCVLDNGLHPPTPATDGRRADSAVLARPLTAEGPPLPGDARR